MVNGYHLPIITIFQYHAWSLDSGLRQVLAVAKRENHMSEMILFVL